MVKYLFKFNSLWPDFNFWSYIFVGLLYFCWLDFAIDFFAWMVVFRNKVFENRFIFGILANIDFKVFLECVTKGFPIFFIGKDPLILAFLTSTYINNELLFLLISTIWIPSSKSLAYNLKREINLYIYFFL